MIFSKLSFKNIFVFSSCVSLLKIFIIVYGEGLLVDDAYITLRYAQNLLEHSSLTYNIGENVLGVTTPLYLLYTSILVALFSDHTSYAMLLSGVFFWYLAHIFLDKVFTLNSVSVGARYIFAVIFFTYPSFWDNQFLGMETPLFILLFSLGLYFFFSYSFLRFAFVAGLLPLVRPEAVILFPGLLYLSLYAPMGKCFVVRARSFQAAFVFLAAPIAWCTFAFFYYGSAIPHSMIAKSGWTSVAYASNITLLEVLRQFTVLSLVPFLDFFNPLAAGVICLIAILIATCVIVSALRERSNLAIFSVISFVCYILFFLLGQGATEASWYSIPPSLYLLIGSLPLISKVERLVQPSKLILPLFVAFIFLSGVAHVNRQKLLKFYDFVYSESAVLLNHRINNQSPDLIVNVVIGEIGVYGYHSRHRIIDAAALVSPEVLMYRNNGISFVSMLKAVNADYVVFGEGSLADNHYDGFSSFFNSNEEREWFLSNFSLVFSVGEKLTFESTAVSQMLNL